MQAIWRHLREEVIAADTNLTLRDNGLRAGVGHAEWWDPIRATIEGVEGEITTVPQPVRVPAGFPLALELDTEARDQTLFYVGRDGVLSGDTWDNSRNVLRVTYMHEPRSKQHARLYVVPEVRKTEPGMRIVRTAAGLWQVPRHDTKAFEAAGFEVTLGPEEFLLVGPSKGDGAYGLIGSAFLSQEVEGELYDSYVILRPDLERAHAVE